MEKSSQTLILREPRNIAIRLRIYNAYRNNSTSRERGDIDVLATGYNPALYVWCPWSSAVDGCCSKTYFPKLETNGTELLSAFIPTFISLAEIPKEIIVNHKLEEKGLIAETLAECAEKKCSLVIVLSHREGGFVCGSQLRV